MDLSSTLKVTTIAFHSKTFVLTSFCSTGVAYQLQATDPLIDTAQCSRDAALMKELGANTIRVYHVDSSADHTGCMNVFAQNGIYLFVDMDTVSTYIREVRRQLGKYFPA
jgi:hypothetical protein